MVDNTAQAGRFIVGGLSPHALKLPASFLQTGKVIGINKWPMFFNRMDYWIALDTERLFQPGNEYWDEFRREWFDNINVPRFLRLQGHRFSKHPIPEDIDVNWFKIEDDIHRGFSGYLRSTSTTAAAAMSLAVCYGAKEIFLFGVDLVGESRLDGSKGCNWQCEMDIKGLQKPPHVEAMNIHIARIQAFGVKVYKLHPESQLECALALLK